jgi:hypothetical protein
MEILKALLFENPTLLYVALGLVEIALAVMWFMRRHRPLLYWMLVTIAAGGMFFALERLVVTDREQIVLNVREAAGRVEANDVAGACEFVDDPCRGQFQEAQASVGETLSRDAIRMMGEQVLKANPVRRLGMGRLTVDVGNQTARMDVMTIIEFSGGDLSNQTYLLVWEFRWTKKAGKWVINEMTCKPGVKL